MPKVIKKTVEQVTTQAFRNDLANKIKQNIAYRDQYLGSYGKLPILPANLDADLEECLQQEPLEKLCAIYKDVTGDTLYLENKRKAVEKKQEGIFGFFEPIIEIFTKLFSGEGGGFFGQLMEMFQQMNISFNPGADLTAKEKEMSEYSSLFVKVSEKLPDLAKDINHLYRKLQKETNTGEQIFNGLLRHIKTMGSSQAREAHKLLKLAEMQLLGGRVTDAGMNATISTRVLNNLTIAYNKAYGIASGTPIPGGAPNFHLEKIQSAGDAVGRLVTLIAEQENKLKDSKLKKEEKKAVYESMQKNKTKLLHIVVKTDALAAGETLKPGQQLDQTYMDKQLAKFPDITGGVLVAAAAQPNKSIFKLFQNNGINNDTLNNSTSYENAIKKAKDDRFEEMAKQVATSQKVVVDLNTLWAKYEKTKQDLNAQIQTIPGPQRVVRNPEYKALSDKVSQLCADQIEVASEAVAIQNQINLNISGRELYDAAILAAVANPPANIAQGAAGKATEVNNVIQRLAQKIYVSLAAAGGPAPAGVIPELFDIMKPAAINALVPTVAEINTPIGTQLQKAAVIKTLQEESADLLDMATQARENLLAAKREKSAVRRPAMAAN